MELEWTSGVADVRCAVCGRSRGQELLATTEVDWQDDRVEIVRCGDCRSVLLSAVKPPSAYSESDWDWYVEQLAGIETIAAVLAKVAAPTGARMLDVGCGYGFGLDIARVLFGWQGIGLDPSLAAERGRADLGLDIRPGTLDDAFEPDERFDVIFASEVLEHVPDPRGFLVSVERRLSDRGVFLMTTPDAAAVSLETPMTTLYPALSVGAHEFLLTQDGLVRMFEDAGLESEVWVEGATIMALAAKSRTALRATRRSASVSTRDLVRYCDIRAEQAEAGSALSVGMRSRRLKFAVNGYEYAVAAAGLPGLRQAVRDRYEVDLDQPATTLPLARRRTALVVIHHFAGLVALNHERDPRAAAEHFNASAAVGKAQFDVHGLYPDPETPTCEFRSLGHRALALAQFDPDAVPDALAELDEAVARGAGDPEQAREFRARAEGEVLARRSAVGTRRMKARAWGARGYRRLARSKAPLVAKAARKFRGLVVRSPAIPGPPSSDRPTSGGGPAGDRRTG